MNELVQAVVYTIGKFVTMLFSIQVESGISVGNFLIASGVLCVVIKIIFNAISTPGYRSQAGIEISKGVASRVRRKK